MPPAYNIKIKFLAVLTSALLCGTSNAAQTDTNLDTLMSLSMEELLNLPITTTSFFPETDLDTGSTVTVINASYWQDRGARRLDDALSYMPGVAINPTFLGTRQWAIRGYPNSNAAGVQTLWDGVPLNTYPIGSAQADHPNIQLNTLNSIEVIRGPGSALYGSDAMHGVVSLQAYEADNDEQTGTIRAGSNGYYEGALRGSYQFAGNWRANIALATNGQPDQDFEYTYLDAGTPTQSERDYNYSTSTTSVKINSDPAKKASYKFGLYYNKYDHDGFFHNGTDVPSDDNSYIDSSLSIIKAEANYKLSQTKKVTINLSNWEYDHHFARTLGNLNSINIFATEQQNTFNAIYTDEKLADTTELSLALGHKDNDVSSAHRTVNTPTGTELLNVPLSFSGHGRTIHSFLLDGKTRSSSGKNIFRYGFRLDDYSDFGDQFTPRLGFIHFLNKHEVVKALYGNSFRAPTGNELYGGPQQMGDLTLQPEELNSIEFIYITKHNKWKAEAALFFSELKNGIRLTDHDNNPVTLNKFTNVSESDSTGIELSYYKTFSNWTLDTNGSYIISQNQTDEVDLTIFPEYIFNLAIAYHFSNKWQLTVNNHIELERTRTQPTATKTPEDLPHYFRTDINFSKDYNKNMKVFVNVRNVFNRDNELPSTQDDVDSVNFTTGIQDEEISIDIGMNYRF